MDSMYYLPGSEKLTRNTTIVGVLSAGEIECLGTALIIPCKLEPTNKSHFSAFGFFTAPREDTRVT